jgi:hypothetical protein
MTSRISILPDRRRLGELCGSLLRLVGLRPKKAGGGVGDRVDHHRAGVKATHCDREREIVVPADGDPAAAGGGERQERLRDTVEVDLGFGAGGGERHRALAEINRPKPQCERGVRLLERAWMSDLVTYQVFELDASDGERIRVRFVG